MIIISDESFYTIIGPELPARYRVFSKKNGGTYLRS